MSRSHRRRSSSRPDKSRVVGYYLPIHGHGVGLGVTGWDAVCLGCVRDGDETDDPNGAITERFATNARADYNEYGLGSPIVCDRCGKEMPCER